MIAGSRPATPLPEPAPEPEALGLYVHVPFCTSRCGYCDFNAYAGVDHLVPEYVEALVSELGLWSAAARGQRVVSVFFGGGTPSLLPLAEMARIVEAIGTGYEVAAGAEWTLEANPTELTGEHLRGLADLGIGRLSMGVQSMHPEELALLDRQHTPERVEQAVADARAAGFSSLNLDLIFGLPEQPLARWQQSVERVLALGPDHLSCYALSVEPGTPLHYRVAKGEVPEPDPDDAAEQYEWVRDRLGRAGYAHYEISNWARPGSECRHNLVYWRAEPYLGVGAGAHSYFRGRRFADVDAPNRYVESVRETLAERRESGRAQMRQVASGETPSPEQERADALILGLRLREGISDSGFRRRFGVSPADACGEAIRRHLASGLLEREGDVTRLSERGLLLANEVFVDLLPEDAPAPDPAPPRGHAAGA
ncbi:MAG: radical SAM family heme chaperone HemW [Chloroflexi bacterium]|nr:radical SAM family heme chaperone HemW [Chloroflexota bacterium]